MSLTATKTISDDLLLTELDLDLELDFRAETGSEATPTIRSVILCTPGCTSQNTGSGCSWCC